MKKNDEKQTVTGLWKPKPSTQDLRGRQSVRATFRLSPACIDAISILSTQLGIKQKSVFDHILEDAEALREVASRFADTGFELNGRIQKTFVISRRSLSSLDEISGQHNAPRDALVEYSVRRLLPIINSERLKHEQRKSLLAEISGHYKRGQALLLKAEKLLDKEDPVVSKFKNAMSAHKNALTDIIDFIEKGKILEEFQTE